MREPSSSVCENRRVLCARTVEFCVREPSSSVCENRRVLKEPSSMSDTFFFSFNVIIIILSIIFSAIFAFV